MPFPEYYNREEVRAKSMRDIVTRAQTNRAPPDITLFYILNAIKDLSNLGLTTLSFINNDLHIDIINQLKQLNYKVDIDKNNIIIIRWE